MYVPNLNWKVRPIILTSHRHVWFRSRMSFSIRSYNLVVTGIIMTNISNSQFRHPIRWYRHDYFVAGSQSFSVLAPNANKKWSLGAIFQHLIKENTILKIQFAHHKKASITYESRCIGRIYSCYLDNKFKKENLIGINLLGLSALFYHSLQWKYLPIFVITINIFSQTVSKAIFSKYLYIYILRVKNEVLNIFFIFVQKL